MFDDRGIEARHFCVGLGKNISIFLEEGFICGDFLRSASSSNGDLVEMSILMVGEMLAMLPSSKASGAGMGFLNQSIGLDGIKSLVSTV
jgi:hypothetical protein